MSFNIVRTESLNKKLFDAFSQEEQGNGLKVAYALIAVAKEGKECDQSLFDRIMAIYVSKCREKTGASEGQSAAKVDAELRVLNKLLGFVDQNEELIKSTNSVLRIKPTAVLNSKEVQQFNAIPIVMALCDLEQQSLQNRAEYTAAGRSLDLEPAELTPSKEASVVFSKGESALNCRDVFNHSSIDDDAL